MADNPTIGRRGGDATPYGIGAAVAALFLSAVLASDRPAGSSSPGAQAHGPRPTTEPESHASGNRDASAARGRVTDLLEEFFALPPSEDDPQARFDRARGTWRERGGAVLIATLPDPAESKVGYTFDQQVEALESAAAARGYVLNGFRLPWRVGGESPEQRWTASAGGPNDTATRATWESPRSRGHTQPGAILFRGTKPRPRPDENPLLVLVVGETPTRGVQVQALTTALDLARDLAPADGAVRLTIVGPMFSGGAHSVATVVEKWRSAAARVTTHVRIISGTLTSITAAKELRTLAHASAGHITFTALDLPVKWALATMHRFVRQHGDGGIAMLVELGTAFGAASRQPGKGQEQEVEYLSYPLHIAHIRSAFEKAQGRDGGTRIRSIEARNALELPLEFVRDAETPPSFLPENAAIVAERLLAQKLDLLRAQHCKFVGIVGTDAYDRIFVARMVRRHVPDAQLFMIGSDVLYLHPSYTSDLLGMWVGSTDPTDPATAPATAAMEANTSFAAAGFQRAVRMALGRHSHAHPAGGLWISAVGRGAFWPVAFVAADRQNSDVDQFQGHPPLRDRGPSDLDRPLRAGVFWLVLAAGGVGALGLSALRLIANGPADTSNGMSARVMARLPSVARVLRSPQAAEPTPAWLARLLQTTTSEPTDTVWALSLLLLPTALLGYGIALVWPVLSQADWRLRGAWDLVVSGVVALWISALWPEVGRQAPSGQGSLPLRKAHPGLRAAIIAVAALLAASAGASSVVATSPTWLRFERAANLSSGLSPILPSGLLTLALLVLVLAGAQRSRLRCYRDDVEKAVGNGNAGDHAFVALRTAAVHTLGRLGGAPRTLGGMGGRFALPGAVTCGLLVLLEQAHVASLEGAWFDLAVYAAISLLVFAITDGWMQFFFLWQSLRRFLRATAATPLKDAFRDLPKEMGRTFGLRLYERPLDATQLSQPLAALRELHRSLRHEKRPLAADVSRAVSELEQLANNVDGTRIAAPAALFATHEGDVLAEISGKVLDQLGAIRSGARGTRFVAMEITRLTSFVFAILKNRALSCTVAIALLLLAVASYPLPPQHRLLTLSLVGLAVTATVVLRTLVEIERNELLSLIADRTPDQVNFDRNFLSQVATYAGIPALSLLATELPALGQQLSGLFAWIGG